MDEEKRQRIGNMQGALMIAVAATVDGIQFLLNFIPFVGWIFTALISIFAWLTFFVWFKFNGVGFLEGKAAVLKFSLIFGVSILEIIPVLNDLPAWIAYIVLMILIVRAEDVMYNKIGGIKKMPKILSKKLV